MEMQREFYQDCLEKSATSTAVKESEVTRELKSLEMVVASLKERINSLGAQLQPALREETPHETSDKAQSCQSDLGKSIRNASDEIYAMYGYVNDLLKRLEI